jgi:histidinol-phosphate aminotransferase
VNRVPGEKLSVICDPCDLAPANIRAIAPYQPGKPISELARELGLAERTIIKLASNENPLGASPKGLAAAEASLADIARYPDGSGFELKVALGQKLGIETNRMVLGNGSNDVLEMAARSFLAPGTSAVYSQHAFAVYALAVQATGAAGIEAPARDYGHGLGAMAAAVRDDTRMVFIANPNNPTGTLLSNAELEGFLKQMPRRVVVVLDEAYGEYLPAGWQSRAQEWLERFPNLVVTRTFSKAYGLAGLRVGYALSSAGIADLMNRVRQPFNVTSPALAAAAAALDDLEFLERSYALNQLGMKQLVQGFDNLRLEFISSAGNFICVRVGPAQAVFQAMLRRGVIVRPVANYGMPEHLRISIGLAQENAKCLLALEEALLECR